MSASIASSAPAANACTSAPANPLIGSSSTYPAAAGWVLLDPHTGRAGALVQAFAAGALLAMLADTLLPEAYAVEGVFTGTLVVAGFAVSLALAAI